MQRVTQEEQDISFADVVILVVINCVIQLQTLNHHWSKCLNQAISL